MAEKENSRGRLPPARAESGIFVTFSFMGRKHRVLILHCFWNFESICSIVCIATVYLGPAHEVVGLTSGGELPAELSCVCVCVCVCVGEVLVSLWSQE